MEPALFKAIAELFKMGAGYVVAAVFGLLFYLQWKRSNLLADKLYEIGILSIKNDTETIKQLESVEKTLDRIEGRVS